mgnify:FL=1|tara:strand:- start:275 stop:1108 length:834 start_codon:yes stop_codon:yes gene_type:complete
MKSKLLPKCGITGYSGVLGREIIKNINFRFIKYKHDILDKKKLDKWMKKNKFDLFLHLAAVVPTKKVEKNYFSSKNVNLNGTKNIVDNLNKYHKNLGWFFFSSTSHVYTHSKYKIVETKKINNCFSKYGKTKYQAEKYINKKLNKKINCCIGRIFSFSHPNQNASFFIPSILKKIRKSNKKIIIFKNVDHERDFISTKDISKIINLLYQKKRRGIYNIGTGKCTNLIDVIRILCKRYDRNYKILNIRNRTKLVADISKLKKEGIKINSNIRNILQLF